MDLFFIFFFNEESPERERERERKEMTKRQTPQKKEGKFFIFRICHWFWVSVFFLYFDFECFTINLHTHPDARHAQSLWLFIPPRHFFIFF